MQNESPASPVAQYISPEQVAALLDVKVGTLAAWRCRGEGPDFFRFNSLIRYDRKVIDAWAEARRVTCAPPPKLQQPDPLPDWLKPRTQSGAL